MLPAAGALSLVFPATAPSLLAVFERDSKKLLLPEPSVPGDPGVTTAPGVRDLVSGGRVAAPAAVGLAVRLTPFWSMVNPDCAPLPDMAIPEVAPRGAAVPGMGIAAADGPPAAVGAPCPQAGLVALDNSANAMATSLIIGVSGGFCTSPAGRH